MSHQINPNLVWICTLTPKKYFVGIQPFFAAVFQVSSMMIVPLAFHPHCFRDDIVSHMFIKPRLWELSWF